MGRTWSDEAASARSDRAAAARDGDEPEGLRRQAEAAPRAAAPDREVAGPCLHRAGPERARALDEGPSGAPRGERALAALQSEVDRARRTGSGLVVGCVVINGLSHPNGWRDRPDVRRIVECRIRASLRSYDVVVRRSEDEFVYAVECADVDLATQRFETIRASLDPVTGAWLTAGFALLREHDSLAEVIARAAAEVVADRAPV